MCEVIFLKILTCVKRELHCANLRPLLIVIPINFIFGILSVVIGGHATLYRYLLLPKFAPSFFFFPIVWSLIYLLMGSAFALIFSRCRCGTRRRLEAILLYALLMLWMLLWYPCFFGSRLFTLSLVISALILSTSLFVFRAFMSRSILSGLLMIPCILWFGFCMILNFCIILLN